MLETEGERAYTCLTLYPMGQRFGSFFVSMQMVVFVHLRLVVITTRPIEWSVGSM